jgi:formate hydrogenlyase subunit 3/multisubunit Na+/H+ antiporter MnhD subunit
VTFLAGPVVLLVFPLLAAGVTYLVRRWSFLAAWISALTAAVLAILCLRLPLDRSALVLGREVAFGQPVVILGRTLVLDPAGQIWLAFVFGVSAILYLVAWRISQGHSFFSFSLVILSMYSLTVTIQDFPLGVMVFALAATLAVFIVQAGQLGSVRGAQRYLVVTLLAVPCLLAAAWLLNQSQLQLVDAEMIRSALLLAGMGFAMLLAVIPFSSWMPSVAADAPPAVTAFLFLTGQAMALFLAFVFLRDTPFSMSDPGIVSGLQLAGLVMAVVGGIMAATQRDFGRLFGYAAVADLGYLLLALGVGRGQGIHLALLHTVGRAVSIILLAASLAILRHRATTDHFDRLQGVARRLPVATLGLILGSLGLAGFPLTAGFPTHWAVSRAAWNWVRPLSPLAQETVIGIETVPGQQWVWGLTVAALLASSVGIIIGVLRGLSAMLGTDPREDIARQPLIASLMVVALAGAAILLGLYPQLFLEPIQRAAQVFSLF